MILDEIVKATKIRVKKNRKNFYGLKNESGEWFSFEKKICESGISFICEVKKASPSKCVIAENFPFVEIGKEYEKAGASCISVLTEPDFFMGSNEHLEEIKKNVTIPILRKDFIIDEFQIFESKAIGADAILLICTILSDAQLKEYLAIAHSLGLSVLVEAHDQVEVEKAIKCGAKIIGVNNRNLTDFSVNIENSINLRKLIPKNILFVSESGIKTRKNIEDLEKNNVDAVLIGETLMLSKNKKYMLEQLKGVAI